MLAMQSTLTRVLRNALIVLGFVSILSPAYADSTSPEAVEKVVEDNSAHGLIRKVTVEMLDVLKNSNSEKVGEDVFQQQVLNILEPVVDFEFISRSVMGGYAAQAQDEQKAKFTEVFKKGLISTYSKGVSGFADREIVTLPPEHGVSGQGRVSVNQDIAGPDNVDHLSYTMAMNRKGEWKLINVVMNGVNLGKTFRNQFAQAMVQNKGNIDAVISNWGKEG